MLTPLRFIHHDQKLRKVIQIENSALSFIKIMNQEKITKIRIFRDEIKEKDSNFCLNQEYYESLIPELNCISAKISRQARIVKSTLAYYVISELIK